MPNWCHNTLIVSGTDEAIQAFIEKARRSRTDEEDEQPLTFQAHAPIPPADEIADLAEKRTCGSCGGSGKSPKEINDESGSLVAVDVETCLHCEGKGDRILAGGWYEWCIQNWGTKWDAHFDGPSIALCAEAADVDISVDSHALVSTPGLAIYRFLTAWSPPIERLQIASGAEVGLSFKLRFGEPGEDFAGEVCVEGGKIISEQKLSIEEVLDPKEMWF